MCIKLRKYVDIFPQECHVTTFAVDHNHKLLSPSETRFLRSNRSITDEDEKRILLLEEGGLTVRQIMRVDIAIEDIEQVQLHDTMLETYRGSSLRTMSSLEEQAHDVLTPYCFKKFQEQFGKATLFSLIHEDGYMFVLKYYEDTCYNKRHNLDGRNDIANNREHTDRHLLSGVHSALPCMHGIDSRKDDVEKVSNEDQFEETNQSIRRLVNLVIE
ncbi:hypothetical protein LguiA_002676 [Lonicera macranthoides]